MFEKDQSTHCFTAEVLETIIDKNLTLYQYYDHLQPLLKSAWRAENAHGKNAHKRQQSHQSPTQSPYSSLIREQVFSFELIEECLSSKQFIQKLHPYVNSLFTTTNIGIVKETLKIYMLMESNVEKFKALHRIKDAVNILTLYQVDKNVTSLVAQIDYLNSIFCKIGLIITSSQFNYYYGNVWRNIPEEMIQVDYSHCHRKLQSKYVQIYDLLPLAVQMEEIRTLKFNLRQWMSSEEFSKHHAKRVKMMKDKAKSQCKQPFEQNMDIARLRVQHLAPDQLLKQIQLRGYEVQKNQLKFLTFREGFMEILSREDKKREILNLMNSKNTMGTAAQSQEGRNPAMLKNNRSKVMNNLSRTLSSPTPTLEKPQQNRQKLEQEAFNIKVLNGCFVKKQVHDDLAQGNVEFISNYAGQDDAQPEQITSSLAPTFTHFRMSGLDTREVKNSGNLRSKMKKNPIMKLVSIDNSLTDSISSGSQKAVDTEQEINVSSQNYFKKIKQKIKSQPFFRIGNKILRQ